MTTALGVRVAELEAERSLTLHLARTDALTGLLNRGAFTSALIERLEDAHESGDHIALFVIDLDRFKHLNDTLGHHAGDLLLNEIGTRLRTQAQAGDLVARLGGDEFALISAHPDVARRAEQITTALAQPYWIYGRTVAPAPRSAWRCSPMTLSTPPTCSASPTWPSIAPRPAAVAAPRSSTATCARPATGATAWRPTCAAPFPAVRSSPGISRW
uniref:GGDEF domain-containing protein n=1 Tax=Phenylobacterium glaciei TaxID=2803784 RepID=A0A974S8U6_9CAUL|nr:GGDEF domain-containing protein [Phenylobacterium glaciei]